MIGCKPLLEQEKVIHVVEDTMEIWSQEIWLNEACFLAKVRLIRLAYHCFKVVLIELLDLLTGNWRQTSLLSFWSSIKELSHPSNLEKESYVWVDSFFLEQEVMSLLEVLECKIILRQLTQIHDKLAWHVEFDTPSMCFFVSLENHVHEHFQLSGPFLWTESNVIGCWTCREWVVLGVTSLEHNFSLIQSTSMN